MSRPIPDEVILGLLKAQPSHGYELLDSFKSRSQLGHSWHMSTSQLYAVLKRLEREGAIIGRDVKVDNAPSRVEYKITHQGAQQLESWLFDPQPSASVHRIRVLFISRIYIANLLNIPTDRIIDAQLSACLSQRDRFIRQKQSYHSEIELLTLEFIISQLDSAIIWLKKMQLPVSEVTE